MGYPFSKYDKPKLCYDKRDFTVWECTILEHPDLFSTSSNGYYYTFHVHRYPSAVDDMFLSKEDFSRRFYTDLEYHLLYFNKLNRIKNHVLNTPIPQEVIINDTPHPVYHGNVTDEKLTFMQMVKNDLNWYYLYKYEYCHTPPGCGCDKVHNELMIELDADDLSLDKSELFRFLYGIAENDVEPPLSEKEFLWRKEMEELK
jgi:hypothetical protein